MAGHSIILVSCPSSALVGAGPAQSRSQAIWPERPRRLRLPAFARRVGLAGYSLANAMPANALQNLYPGGSIHVQSLDELRRMTWDLRRQAEDFIDETGRRLANEGVKIVGAPLFFNRI